MEISNHFSITFQNGPFIFGGVFKSKVAVASGLYFRNIQCRITLKKYRFKKYFNEGKIKFSLFNQNDKGEVLVQYQ